MSFIGPRPWISDVIIISLLFKKRNLLKPGLTGLA